MQTSLKVSQTILVGLLMFGLFFGAGNLIFPVLLGQQAGFSLWPASLGFLVTAVTVPVLGIAAAAMTRSKDMYDMGRIVCKPFAYFFSAALCLSIGPAFAIPRTATVSYEVGIRPFIEASQNSLGLFLFSLFFFAIVLFVSLRAGQIVKYVGKYLTPAFLVVLAILLFTVIFVPMGDYHSFSPIGAYATRPFPAGMLDGYNTLDGLASLVFCIIVINAIQGLGVEEPKRIAREVAKAGVVCVIAMSAIYLSLAYMGATSSNIIGPAKNGGIILSLVSKYYFSTGGQILLAFIVGLACLKTSIGLVTGISEVFARLFPILSQKAYTWLFCLISLGIANVGLEKIIQGSIPVLVFLYPIVLVFIILGLLHPCIGLSRPIYGSTVLFTLVAATFDFVNTLPKEISTSPVATAYLSIAHALLPGFSIGFGWLVPAAIGFAIGIAIHKVKGPGTIPS